MCGFEKGKKIWRGGAGGNERLVRGLQLIYLLPHLNDLGGGRGLIQIAIQKGTGTFKRFRIEADIPMIIRWGVRYFCVKIFSVTVFFVLFFSVFCTLSSSVADPDPNPDPDTPDPHVFGPPGSGSNSQLYGSGSGSCSGSGSFYHHTKIVRETLIPTIL